MKRTLVAAILGLAVLFAGATQSSALDQAEVYAFSSSLNDDGWLGVSIRDMTPKLARTMEVKTDRGALVSEVMEDSPAEKAGLKQDDVVVEFDGTPVTDADDLRSAVRKTKPGTDVSIAVSRKNDRKTLTVTVKKRPRSLAMAPLPHIPRITMNSSDVLGMRVSTLEGQLAEYFNAPNGQGVLVEHVEPNSRGDEAGFKAGDVITGIGSRTVKDIRSLHRTLGSYDDGEKAQIQVLRKGNKQTLAITVEEDDVEYFFFRGRPQSLRSPEGIREMEMHMRPHLEDLKIELEGLRDKLKHDMKDLKDNINVRVRSALRRLET